MDFDRLKLFRDVAHSRSVSKGAGLNGISQSAVSQYLQDLEEQLGMTLLDRGSRPLTVTEAGKLYLDMCRDILNRRDEFQVALDVAERRSGRHRSRGFDLLGWAIGTVASGNGVRSTLSARSHRSAIPSSGKGV